MIDALLFQENLDLECLYPSGSDHLRIKTPEIVRPGLQLSGFYQYFDPDRIQVLGMMEMTYLRQMSSEKCSEVLKTFSMRCSFSKCLSGDGQPKIIHDNMSERFGVSRIIV